MTRPELSPRPAASTTCSAKTTFPADAYWGIHTKRAVENFPITGVPIGHFPELIQALAMVKKAAARANRKLGFLPATRPTPSSRRAMR